MIYLLKFITFEVKLPTNPGKLSLAKGIATFVSAFFPKLANQEPKDPPDWIVLDTLALLSFIISWYIISKSVTRFSCFSCIQK